MALPAPLRLTALTSGCLSLKYKSNFSCADVSDFREMQTQREKLPDLKKMILYVEIPPPGDPFGKFDQCLLSDDFLLMDSWIWPEGHLRRKMNGDKDKMEVQDTNREGVAVIVFCKPGEIF
ncbi:hypothetical protein TURU_013271 [Turdus rufiventris]|nr:hypothetical protein TURU_013271 [Turdus rufiventris]